MLSDEVCRPADLLHAVCGHGYEQVIPVRKDGIPLSVKGRKVIEAGSTGAEKTAGFTLPIPRRLGSSDDADNCARALILTPTRELARHIGRSSRNYGRYQSATARRRLLATERPGD